MAEREVNRAIRAQAQRAGRAGDLGRAFVVSGASQAVSSLTNFGIVLFLVRAMDKPEFGLYSLGFALVLMAAGLVTDSIAVQFVVNLPDQAERRRALYAANHMAAVAVVGVVAVIVAVVMATGLEELAPDAGRMAHLPVPVVTAAAAYTVRDLLMRVAFSERREHLVLGGNVAVAIAVAAAFILTVLYERELSAASALYVYAAGQSAGALCALLLLRLPIRDIRSDGVCQAFRDSWAGGKWSVLTSLTYTMRTQAHNFVIAPLLGIAALAEVNAARVLLTPAVMAIPPFTQVILPRLAERRRQGGAELLGAATRWVGLLTLAAMSYCFALMFLLPWILVLTLGNEYAHIGPLVGAWCVVTVALALRNGLTIALQSVRAFRELMILNFLAAAVALGLGFELARLLGGAGAIGALAVSELVLCGALLVLIRSKFSELQAEGGTLAR